MSYKSITKNQKGFTAVEGLLIVLIVLVVGFIGYYVHHTQDQDKAAKVATTAAKTTPPKTTTSTSSTTSDNSTVSLAITEWGVKMPLDSAVKDAYYTMQNGSTTAYLSLESLKGTDCAADQTSLGSILRFTATDTDDSGSTYLSDYPSATKVGTYYYYFIHSQGSCGSDTATQNTAAAAQLDFAKDVTHIVAD